MRPINLIPVDERRSHGGASRTGPLAYILVGALFVLLAGVVMLVLTSNQISERKEEVTSLTQERELVAARADSLAAYSSFQQVAHQRTETIAALADGRFDWERVFRQLALILPPHVWLSSLSGSAGGGAGGEASGSEASSILAPTMTLSGCAPEQNTVAALVASLKEIDGVTRVGLENSTRAQKESSGSAEEVSCKATEFNLSVVFDGAPPSPDVQSGEAEPEASSSEGEATASSSSTTPAG